MQRIDLRTSLVIVGVGCAMLPAASTAQIAPAAPPDSPAVVAHSSAISERSAALTFELAGGAQVELALSGGRVSIAGEPAGTYEPGGALERSWRALVRLANTLDPGEMLEAAQRWTVEDLTAADVGAHGLIVGTVAGLAGQAAVTTLPPAVARPPAIPPAPALRALDERLPVEMDELRRRLQVGGLELSDAHVRMGDYTVPRGEVVDGSVAALRGDITVEGRVTGDVVALDGDVVLRAGGAVDGDVFAINGAVIRAGGVVRGAIRSADVADQITSRQVYVPRERPGPSILARIGSDVGGLLATFVALAGIGFGLVLVAPRQLEIVADTVRGSFWRSFLAGVLAQSLLLPLFAVTAIGLVLTVIGILFLPFAVLALAVITIIAVLGGYLASARSVGELYVRRRMALGHAVGGLLTYKYVLYGLVALLAIWGPAVLFGWVPVAGTIMTVSAGLFTWVMMTTGFGATILSRAGIRGTFTRRFDEALSDQYLYYTPQATPVVQPRLPDPPPR